MGRFDEALYANPIPFIDSFFASQMAIDDYCDSGTQGDLNFPWKCGLAMKKFVKKNATEILHGKSHIKKESSDYFKVLVSAAFYMNDLLEHSIHPAWYVAHLLANYKRMNPDPKEVAADIGLQREFMLGLTSFEGTDYVRTLSPDSKIMFARKVLGAGCLDSKIIRLTDDDIPLAADFFEEFSENTGSRGSWYLGSRVMIEDAVGVDRDIYYSLDNYIAIIKKFKNDLELMSADELDEMIINLKKPEYYLQNGNVIQNRSLKDGSIIHNHAFAKNIYQ